MSIERALVAQAGPHMLAAKARLIIEGEASKGCLPDILPEPVALEPSFCPVWDAAKSLENAREPAFVPEKPPREDDLLRLRVWISSDQKFDWRRSELFLKQLQRVARRVGLEISGNQDAITTALLCHRDDLPVVSAAFRGEFECCELSPFETSPLVTNPREGWSDMVFVDLYTLPPYSWLLTRPEEIHYSPYEPLLAAMMTIPSPAFGIYQAVFQPVHSDHDWHTNVERLLDIEFVMKLHSGLQLPQRYAQQAPSGDLRQMAGEVVTKAHADKPFFCLAVRVAVLGAGAFGKDCLRSLATFASVFQHGGRPLSLLSEADYAPIVSGPDLKRMFALGTTHRPGFLVNSWELAGLVHIPPASVLEGRRVPMPLLTTLPVYPGTLSQGTLIGMCDYAGESRPVFIPPRSRKRQIHLIGAPGMGKSTVIENMVLQDITEGLGVAVIDPHGDLVGRLPRLIPEAHVDRIVYFDPGDRDFVPLWNPIKTIEGQDAGRAADDLVGAIKSVVTGWGDRLAHLLRHAFYALLHRPDSTLLDVANLLRFKSEESERLRKEILHYVHDEPSRQFWREDYRRYGFAEATAAQHKLSKMLLSGTISLMLSQPESRFSFRQIMDESMIFFANLSTIGSEAREILGCLLLSLFHQTALSRSDTPIEQRAPFHIYCDEAHRFMTDAVEDLLAETRKFAVSLTLAHQYMSQLSRAQANALGGVGSTIIFKVDANDARYLTKDLMEKAAAEDLIALETYEAIARIGTEVVRIKTLPPREEPAKHLGERVIEESQRRYCRPVAEVRKAIRRRYRRYGGAFPPSSIGGSGDGSDGPVEELVYDQF